MPSEPLNRKLTAILYTDVAGYSRLTGGDEEGTHRQVMEVLDYASQQISDAGGNVLRYAGDAILAEFSSAVSAVNTAVDIQREMARKNHQVADDKKVQIRIGINIGDVIEDRGEVFGDGVNLAARLEAAAPEGGICISASVHEQVLGKLEVEFSDGGEEQFKNINRPIHVYRWQPVSEINLSLGNPANSGSGPRSDRSR
jgi:adenylate cyclase